MIDSPASQKPALTERSNRLPGFLAVAKASSMLVLKESNLRLSFDAGDQFLSVSSTVWTDHVGQSFGLGGQLLNTPFSSLQMMGC